jgi:phosphatidylglycerol---prolipoprotein diacylglyceryl transferase
MQQVLFHIPFTSGWVPPDGVPLYGFGAMLFLTFLLTAMVWGPRRVAKVGMPREKLQDMAIVLFLTGIAGARVVYMIQYSDQFPDKSFVGLAKAFVQIWNGGIVFYGSAIGGTLGYILFYQLVLKKFNVSTWQLADACAPLIALGLAVGRIGCYLNGCCWGQVAVEECQPVPLSARLGEFPLLSAHAREQVVRPARPTDRLPYIHGLQTSTGFSLAQKPGVSKLKVEDPRSVVGEVEPGSAAEKAGLKAGDRIVKVNGQANRLVLEMAGSSEAVAAAIKLSEANGGVGASETRIAFHDFDSYKKAADAIRAVDLPVNLTGLDTLGELVQDWPRGRNDIALAVDRGQVVELTFIPRTVTFFPTQLYETVSMVLLILLLLAFQPFRRHNGQVIVVMMLGYSVHRFLNEALRIEPTYAMGLTLSQWISVGMFTAAVLLELFLRATQPRLSPGLHDLGEGTPPLNEAPTAV